VCFQVAETVMRACLLLGSEGNGYGRIILVGGHLGYTPFGMSKKVRKDWD
jgi:hypothetical protein